MNPDVMNGVKIHKIYCCSHDCAICAFDTDKERQEYMDSTFVERWRVWEEIHWIFPEKIVMKGQMGE